MEIPKHKAKFIKEMERQFFSKETIKNYASCLVSFLVYFKEKEHPLHVNEDEFKSYLWQFNDQNTQRANHSAVKKFYEICFDKEKFRYIKYAKKKHTRPIILSEQEVELLLKATKNIKHFCITITLYATGVRINELLSIEFSHLDRANMVIHILHGKGGKQRQATMKPQLLKIFETYYRLYKPKKYLFENPGGGKYSERSVNSFLKANAEKAGIKKRVYAHLLRHCYCSHSLEHGENLYTIATAAGHGDPKITANTYIHGSPRIIARAFSPIDLLPLKNQLQLA